MIFKFLAKFAEENHACKKCGKNVHTLILKGKPYFFNDDLSEHACEEKKEPKKKLDDIRRDPGGKQW